VMDPHKWEIRTDNSTRITSVKEIGASAVAFQALQIGLRRRMIAVATGVSGVASRGVSSSGRRGIAVQTGVVDRRT
jgi:hypothetical protein